MSNKSLFVRKQKNFYAFIRLTQTKTALDIV